MDLLEGELKATDARPIEAKLMGMAKRAYGERLAQSNGDIEPVQMKRKRSARATALMPISTIV